MADVVSEFLKELYFLQVFVFLALDAFPFFAVLFVEAFDESHEVLLDEVFLLAGHDVQPLQFLFDGCPVFAEQLDLVVEFGQFIEDAVLVVLVHPRQVDDCVSAVLTNLLYTRPNIPQSEQIASPHSSQK